MRLVPRAESHGNIEFLSHHPPSSGLGFWEPIPSNRARRETSISALGPVNYCPRRLRLQVAQKPLPLPLRRPVARSGHLSSADPIRGRYVGLAVCPRRAVSALPDRRDAEWESDHVRRETPLCALALDPTAEALTSRHTRHVGTWGVRPSAARPRAQRVTSSHDIER